MKSLTLKLIMIVKSIIMGTKQDIFFNVPQCQFTAIPVVLTFYSSLTPQVLHQSHSASLS